MNNEYLAKARERVPDPQILSVLAAKRAKQLAQGARPMIKCDMTNLLDVALLEIGEGLLTYEFGDDPAVAQSDDAAAAADAAAETAEAAPEA